MMISSLQQQKRVTEQLRREAAIRRILVSQAATDIMKYISDHQQEDCLLVESMSHQPVNNSLRRLLARSELTFSFRSKKSESVNKTVHLVQVNVFAYSLLEIKTDCQIYH
ncbi:Hypothetical predicted protein [Cloeon dipterum]|uniref:Guanine nucleotide-binding protein subunit gamma n=1 Tax=Cloeon dipterum TaxID=197152 RepID=A0A8S1DGE6_9INSE|nr:Hypothetical predicted protein [Cloeon dipterum]